MVKIFVSHVLGSNHARKNTWRRVMIQYEIEARDKRIAELEALNRKITDYSKEKLALIKAKVIRDNIDALLLMNRVEMEDFANNMEKL